MKKLTLMLTVVIVSTLLLSFTGFATEVTDYDQYLLNALKDENVGIRTSAAQLLGERKVVAAVEPLLKMLKSEKRCGCRIIAAKALYDIGDKKALPGLIQVAKSDKNKTVRRVAAAIVQEMQTVKLAQK